MRPIPIETRKPRTSKISPIKKMRIINGVNVKAPCRVSGIKLNTNRK